MLLLLLQIVITLAASWVAVRVMRGVRQPAVIGEIIAGIALGPTLFGALAPALQQRFFPASSMASLRLVAEIAVVLFMFCVGLRVDHDVLRAHRRSAIIVSQASIILPLILGLLLARSLYAEFAPRGTPFFSFALFIGVAMSITAFPVLARILNEHDLARTPIGNVALACAAVDDVTAWSLLTIIAGGSLLVLVRSLAIFGAFMAGAIMPRGRAPIAGKLERISVVLLPLFFAFSGLRTNVTMLADAHSIVVALLVIAVAVIGKLGGSTLAARLMGQSWRDALTIGTLMNTRGLVEVVAVNIAYDLGIITQPMFTIMILMALVTTAATSPLLRALQRRGELQPCPLPTS